MNYLKTSELATYLTRATVSAGSEAKWILVASKIIDAWCRRDLALTHYRKPVRLNRYAVGYLHLAPILKFDPVDTTTGLRIKPIFPTKEGGRSGLGTWTDVTIPADLSEILNIQTGKIELSSPNFFDYGRNPIGAGIGGTGGFNQRAFVSYEADVEVLAGYFVETEVKTAADADVTNVELKSVIGIKKNRTKLTFGDTAKQYLVTDIPSGTTVTLGEGLAADVAVDLTVTEAIPVEVKVAAAMVIEDRLTYEPNAIRMSEELAGILKTRLSRMAIDTMPVDAQELLKDYRLASSI